MTAQGSPLAISLDASGHVTAVVGAILLVTIVGTLAWRAWWMPLTGPERIVLQLRLAQIGALVLATTSGIGAGLAMLQLEHAGAGLEIAVGLAFLVVAINVTLREPHQGLLLLASAFAAHAGFDTLHQPGWLGDTLVPRWYSLAAAITHFVLAALCFLPLLRRNK